jgi:hypothetical protein
VLDGLTWTDWALESAKWAVIVAAPIAALFALLPRSTKRSILIWFWALLPVSVELVVLFIQPFGPALFVGMLLLVALPSWAGLSAVAFAVARRLRWSSGGVEYGDGR